MGKRHLQHVRSNQLVNNALKLPSPDDIKYGEIAINYISGDETISLKNSNNQIVYFNIGKSIKGINVNNVSSTISNNIAAVTISGSNINVGTYTPVAYPQGFTAATPVSGSQTIAEAFNSVETTVSALTQELLDDEVTLEQSIIALGEAAGTIDSEYNIQYNPNTSAHYISAATSLANADDILDEKINDVASSLTVINYAESQTNPGGPAKMAVSIPMGKLDTGSTAAAMTATVSGITELRNGVCCLLTNGVVAATTASTLNINGLGAKPLYASNAAASKSTVFGTAYTMLFIYNETRVAGGCWDVYYGYNSDNNTNGYNVSYYYPCTKVSTNLYRYMLLLTKDETHLLPVNASSNTTATTKTLTTESFDPFGQVYYYSTTTTVSAEATPGNATLWTQYYSVIDLRYAFNEGTTLSANTDVYIVCVPQADGSVKLKSGGHPISQTLPTTEDGYIYKLIGKAYDTYRIVLVQDKPCYYFKDNEIRLWTNQTETDISGKADISHTHVSSAVTIESGYQPTTYPQGFTGATNVQSGQTVTQAFQNVESTISELTDEIIKDEKTISEAIDALTTSAGLIDDDNEIKYAADTQANYISAATSLAEADSLLDAAIGNKADANHTHISSAVTIESGYQPTSYPQAFTGATNVQSGQTVTQALQNVESTISELADEIIKDEKTTDKALIALATAAGTIDSGDSIEYIADTQANYISAATSLAEADSLLDAAIGNKADANHTHLENYARITYPSIFSGAVNVTSSQTVSQAFNAVETTISALTEEILTDERVTQESVEKTVKAAGLLDSNNKIKYSAPQTKILSGATSLYEADELLDAAISNATVAVVNHGTSDTTFALTPNTFHIWGAVTSLNLTLATPTDNTILNEYMFEFESPSTATNLILPNTIEWITIPSIEANKTYQVSIVNNLGVIGGV